MRASPFEWVNAADIPLRARSSDWGGWRLKGLELTYPAYPGGGYPIDLERFTTSAAMLNMIAQVARKEWATDKCLAGLVRALDDLLRPQATLCRSDISTNQIRKLVKTAPPRW